MTAEFQSRYDPQFHNRAERREKENVLSVENGKITVPDLTTNLSEHACMDSVSGGLSSGTQSTPHFSLSCVDQGRVATAVFQHSAYHAK